MSSQFSTNIQDAITNVLAQQATATGSGITSALGGSSSEVTANITNMVNTSISQSEIQNAITAVVQSQTVHGTSGSYAVIGNITQAQTSSLIAKAIMSSNGAVTVVNKVADAIDQKSTAVTTNPIADIVSSIGSVFTGPLTLILIIIIVIGAGLVGLMMLSGHKNGGFDAGSGTEGATLMERAVIGGPPM
jgi:type IV secretory pathway VirB2 component (pilin)